MFEKFGGVETESSSAPSIPSGTEESMIPAILDDPRLAIKPEVPTGGSECAAEDKERGNDPDGNFGKPFNLKNDVRDFLTSTDLKSLVKEKMNDDELRAQLDIRIDNFIRKKRKTHDRSSPESVFYEEKLAESMRDIIEMNMRDAKRIGRIKDYIRSNRDSAQGLKNIGDFWSQFKTIFYDERYKRNKQCRYCSPTILKSGILGELAAEDLLRGVEDYFQDEENKDERDDDIDFADIQIEVSDASPQEDVLQQTDLRLLLRYRGEEYSLPVQVKCKYIESMNSFEGDFITENACIFSQNGTTEFGPYGKEIRKFFKNNPGGGAFMVIPYGSDGYGFGEDGFASNKLRLLVYELLKKEIHAFLTNTLAREE
jgi:hypothetical protein